MATQSPAKDFLKIGCTIIKSCHVYKEIITIEDYYTNYYAKNFITLNGSYSGSHLALSEIFWGFLKTRKESIESKS